MCEEFWEPLRRFMRDRLVKHGMIDQRDYDRLIFTDDPEEAMRSITDVMVKRFGFVARHKQR
jgi:predicted Rossmann-fold nucleotide-binding protein